MPPKPRQIRIEQRGALAAMQALQDRSDEELEREQKFKAAALAILGARAAERYDAEAARDYFRRAIAASRPQERMQLRRMADASLALAERRPDDLKAGRRAPRPGAAVQPPAPAAARSWASWRRRPTRRGTSKARGFVIILLLVIALLALGFGIVKLVSLPFGGASTLVSLLLGIVVIAAILGVLALFGRRRQATAREKARAAQGG